MFCCTKLDLRDHVVLDGASDVAKQYFNLLLGLFGLDLVLLKPG